MPSSACSRHHPHLPSFPTRRSSDLVQLSDDAVDLLLTDHKWWRDREDIAAQGADDDSVLQGGQPHALGSPDRDFEGPLGRLVAHKLRSEEHTSELQSHSDLVCRLLLAPATTHIYPLSLHDALPISCSSATMRSICCSLITNGGEIARTSPPRGRTMTPFSRAASHTRWAAPTETSKDRLVALSLTSSDRKSTRLNSSHTVISYAVFCLLPPPPTSTLFPYTTLFRSRAAQRRCGRSAAH